MEHNRVEILDPVDRRKYLNDLLAREAVTSLVEANVGFRLDLNTPSQTAYEIIQTGPIQGDKLWVPETPNQ